MQSGTDFQICQGCICGSCCTQEIPHRRIFKNEHLPVYVTPWKVINKVHDFKDA